MAAPITVYATLAQFQAAGLPSTATSGVPDEDIQFALQAASDEVSDSFSSQFTLPLIQINNSITMRTIELAALIILDSRGEDPEGQSYKTWKMRANRAQDWLRQVREREIHPSFVVDSSAITDIMPGPQATPICSPWNPGGLTRG
jgi:phage gp36-like protein